MQCGVAESPGPVTAVGSNPRSAPLSSLVKDGTLAATPSLNPAGPGSALIRGRAPTQTAEGTKTQCSNKQPRHRTL